MSEISSQNINLVRESDKESKSKLKSDKANTCNILTKERSSCIELSTKESKSKSDDISKTMVSNDDPVTVPIIDGKISKFEIEKVLLKSLHQRRKAKRGKHWAKFIWAF